MVALYYNNRFICGGTLINDRYVLTAAHCVFNTDRSLFSVKFLLYDRGRPAPESFERRVSYIMTNWFVNAVVFIMNDLALLKLNETVPITDHLYPVCMPVEGETYAGFDASYQRVCKMFEKVLTLSSFVGYHHRLGKARELHIPQKATGSNRPDPVQRRVSESKRIL